MRFRRWLSRVHVALIAGPWSAMLRTLRHIHKLPERRK